VRIYLVVSNNEISMYKSQVHSMLKMFSISRCLLYQIWGFSQIKVYKIGSSYSVRMAKKENVGFLRKLSD
jgi:hypothetical protein